jgi:hypothetical protein
MLIKRVVDIKIKDKDGETALHFGWYKMKLKY